ncbi:MAG: hypothetical protein ACI92E_003171, partial [Oceanicoccus sp.]
MTKLHFIVIGNMTFDNYRTPFPNNIISTLCTTIKIS